jgi:hypothetical protein
MTKHCEMIWMYCKWGQGVLKPGFCGHFQPCFLTKACWAWSICRLMDMGQGSAAAFWSQCFLYATLQHKGMKIQYWRPHGSPLQAPQTSGGSTASLALLSLWASQKRGLADSHLIPRPCSIWIKCKPSCHLTHNECVDPPAASWVDGAIVKAPRFGRIKEPNGKTQRKTCSALFSWEGTYTFTVSQDPRHEQGCLPSFTKWSTERAFGLTQEYMIHFIVSQIYIKVSQYLTYRVSMRIKCV